MADTQLALALALEGVSSPASEEVERLCGVAAFLETLPDPEIDPRFIARLEARLLSEPLAAPAPDSSPALRLVKQASEEPATVKIEPVRETLPSNVIALPRRRFVVRKLAAAAIAAAMLVALPIVAAAQSLPGDLLFPIEQAHQNAAMSHARGFNKALVTEKVARKWYGYGIQMTALGYPNDRIASVFAKAGRLQERATNLVLSLGSPSQIAEIRAMVTADANNLKDFAKSMSGGEGGHPTLAQVISNVVKRANLLSRALGLTVTVTVASPAGSVDVDSGSTSSTAQTGSSSSQGSSGSSQAGPPGTGGTAGGSDPGTTTQKEAQKQKRNACAIIGQKQFGDLLTPGSKALCEAQRATKSKR